MKNSLYKYLNLLYNGKKHNVEDGGHMKLKNILIGLEGLKAKGDLEKEINGIESDSRNVKDGFMFVAIKGLMWMDITI